MSCMSSVPARQRADPGQLQFQGQRRLTGAEAGASIFAFRRRLNVHGNLFWDDVVNPIANVTLYHDALPNYPATAKPGPY